MNLSRALILICITAFTLIAPANTSELKPLEAQNEALFQAIQRFHNPTEEQMEKLRGIFRRSGYIGQGNPHITRHPVTCDACGEKLQQKSKTYENQEFMDICHDKYMAPLYNTGTETAKDAGACIDQFEFPNIPCAYPVVWVRASEAAEICEVLGKRLCDAHEWEGACAGSLEDPDYRFDLAEGRPPEAAVRAMKIAHNKKYESGKTWAYGPEYQEGRCAADSTKSSGCDGGGWHTCGSNTYPAGFFPECTSPLKVYDLHGNAAEHMNLPLNESQMASRGSHTYGYTEMKGSWFIFDRIRAHEDWCRWRAPYWHGTRVLDPKSHHNYHLGFRCCKTLNKKP